MPQKFRKGIDLVGQRAIGAADASAATDLVTLQQMQAAIRGLDWKDNVRVASTGNINLAAPGATIDGVTMALNDRFLAKDQTTASQNGIYVWNGAAVAATRAVDADASAEVTSGMATTVTEGTVNTSGGTAPRAYSLITPNPITLGTTSLTFAVLGGGGAAYSAGNGLNLAGQTFSVVVGNGLLVDGTGVRVDPAIVSRIFQQDCAATTNPQTFTHGLGKRPLVQVIATGGEKQNPDITITTTDITVDWGAAPAAADYRVIAVG